MANRTSLAPNHGGGYPKGRPRLIVIHDLEAPPKRGMAWSLATGWVKTAQVSPHRITDPGETVNTLGLQTVGWHCGNGNSHGPGLEVTGYANYTLAQWTSGDTWEALRLDAKELAAVARELDIPLRWLKRAEVADGVSRGVCTHADISLALGGTNHTDPGPNFPFDAFMRTAQQWAGDYSTGGGSSPNPTTPAGPGGADPVDDWTDMALDPADRKALAADIAAALKPALDAGFARVSDGLADNARVQTIAADRLRTIDDKLATIEHTTGVTDGRVGTLVDRAGN